MGKTSKTDWEAPESMTDEEIDYSDIPSLPDSFLETARVWRPRSKVSVTVEMDAVLLDWLQKERKDWRAGVKRLGTSMWRAILPIANSLKKIQRSEARFSKVRLSNFCLIYLYRKRRFKVDVFFPADFGGNFFGKMSELPFYAHGCRRPKIVQSLVRLRRQDSPLDLCVSDHSRLTTSRFYGTYSSMPSSYRPERTHPRMRS